MDKRLMEAAMSGNSASMQAMASQDRNILLGKTLQGNTCLHISSSHDHQVFCTDVVALEESLLSSVNLDEETPLLAAVTNGYVTLASSLLSRCCQARLRQAILQQDRYGFNALHHAIRNGHTKLALELIEAEPELSQAVSKCNESPMFFAAMRNCTHVCEKLIETPSCAFSGGRHGRNCLHAAVKNGDEGKIYIYNIQSVNYIFVQFVIHDTNTHFFQKL
jgi:ankyrin repeat protein